MESRDCLIAVMQDVVNIMEMPLVKYAFCSLFIAFTLAFVRINIINAVYRSRTNRKKYEKDDDLDTVVDKYDDDRG